MARPKCAHQQADDFFLFLADRMDEGAARLTADGTIRFCNSRLVKMAETSLHAMQGSSFASLLPEEERFAFHENLHFSREKNIHTENSLIRHGKPGLPVRLSLNFFPAEELQQTICLLITDLSEQKSAIRALALFRSWNISLIEAPNEKSLLQQMCDLLVHFGGYRMVWVGYPENNEKKNVRMMAHSGFQAGYLDDLNVSWADDESGRGPTGTAIRTGKASVCHDTFYDRKFARWRERAVARGYRSNLVLPVTICSKIIGAISIYGAQAGVFDETERGLLQQLASSLSYGIASLRIKLGKIHSKITD